MLAIICACKQTISFGTGFSILAWIENDGIAVISGIFAAILFLVTGFLIVFWFWGRILGESQVNGGSPVSRRYNLCGTLSCITSFLYIVCTQLVFRTNI